jgi:hypothetical protein
MSPADTAVTVIAFELLVTATVLVATTPVADAARPLPFYTAATVPPAASVAETDCAAMVATLSKVTQASGSLTSPGAAPAIAAATPPDEFGSFAAALTTPSFARESEPSTAAARDARRRSARSLSRRSSGEPPPRDIASAMRKRSEGGAGEFVGERGSSPGARIVDEGVGEPLTERQGERVWLGVGVPEGVGEGVVVAERVARELAESEGEPLPLPVGEPLALPLALGDCESEAEAVMEAVCVG